MPADRAIQARLGVIKRGALSEDRCSTGVGSLSFEHRTIRHGNGRWPDPGSRIILGRLKGRVPGTPKTRFCVFTFEMAY
jgi:hypothetical protein